MPSCSSSARKTALRSASKESSDAASLRPTRRKMRLLSVGELSSRSGVPVSAIHFYESKGLLRSLRTAGNQRRFAPVMLRYLAIIKAAQRVGIALEDIGRMMEGFLDRETLTAAQWRRLSEQWRQQLDARIVQLVRLRDELDSCIGCGCLSLHDCPLRNPDDVLAQKGAGAHLLERP